MKFSKLIFSAVAASMVFAAQASIYGMDFPSGVTDGTYGTSNGGGEIKRFRTTFNQEAKELWVEGIFGNVPGTTRKTDAFTIALSPGPNPKGHPGELALYYFDGNAAGGPALTVYAYNGQNSATSYFDGNGSGAPPDKIKSSKTDSSFVQQLYMNTTASGDRVLGFKVKTNAIDGHSPALGVPGDWTGSQYGQHLGIWMHQRAGTTSSYGSDGFLTSFSSQCEGWFDGANISTRLVPEPASLLTIALGMGVFGLRARARRNK
ncbi:MAG: hypothetical protein K8R88_09175 [Armatimonadetes bacterium]|nr:hypothetical protein [Armatimonadota bacterium]